MFTEEERAAQRQLEEAVENSLRVSGKLEAGDMMGDFLVVTSVVGIIEETAVAEYFVFFRGGTMLPHIAKGLIIEAEEAVDGGSRTMADEDE